MGLHIQGVGHGDIVQAVDTSWWMVLHGYRSVAGYPPHHTLGRETCLVPVTWPEGGWPVVNGNGTVPSELTVATLPQVPVDPEPVRAEFNEMDLGLEWNYVRPPNKNSFKINPANGTLTLTGSATKLGDQGQSTFIGRRLVNIVFSATTRLAFNPKSSNEEAGMVLLNNGSHFDILVSSIGGKRHLMVRLQFGQTIYESEKVALKPGFVDLRIEGDGPTFVFAYSQDGINFTEIEKADARFLSTETVGGFTGTYVGLYATGNGIPSKSSAVYEWFDYEGK
jgi:alpha-N-arabinofuranosidase